MVAFQSVFLKPGEHIDEFRILDIIGDGGFSVIYKAEDTALDRLVAIKQLNPAVFTEHSTEQRFMREAKLAASLNHPNIVSIFTLKRHEASLFLIMEYLDGGSVRELITQNGNLPPGTILKLASNVCHALEVLHQRGIIHRDIKPENILCTATGDFKLADFGLAHVIQADRRRSSAGPQSGTLLYMSPEQAAGQELTAQSDIYSLATVLYEALAGTYYLTPENVEDKVIDHILAQIPVAPSKANPRIQDTFDEPLLRALAKDPADRYQTAHEFLEAIKAAVARNIHNSSSHPPPEVAEELYTIRTLRDLLNEPKQAMARLELPWLRDSDLPEVLAERGETLIALGNLSGYRLLEQAVATKASLPFAQMCLADYYSIEGDDDAYSIAMIDAIEADADLVYAMHYPKIIDAIQNPPEFWKYVNLFKAARQSAAVSFNIGRVLALVNSYEQDALTAFNTAISQASDFGPAYVGAGSVWLSVDDPIQALPYFEQAIRADYPTYPDGEWHKTSTSYRRGHAYLGLALTAAKAGEFLKSAEAALTLFNATPDVLAEQCDTLLSLYQVTAVEWLEAGRTQEAYDLLTQTVPLAQACSEDIYVAILRLLGSAQAQLGADLRHQSDFDNAVAWLEAAIETLQNIPETAGTGVVEPCDKQLHLAQHELQLARRRR